MYHIDIIEPTEELEKCLINTWPTSYWYLDNDEEETINLTVSSHSVDLCGLLTVTLTDVFTKVTATIPPFHYKSIKVYKGGYYI